MWVSLLAVSLLSQTSKPAYRLSTEFTEAALVFTVMVMNPGTTPRQIVSVGVTSAVEGAFTCLQSSVALMSLADYTIAFHVTEKKKLVKADPPIALAPNAPARFTVSLYPNTTGVCGSWHADVAVVVVLDDGTRLVTDTQRIDQVTVDKFRRRTPAKDDVLGALRHRNPTLRLQGLRQLGDVPLDAKTVELVLRARYADAVRAVRQGAYKQTAALQVGALVPDLTQRCANVSPNGPGEPSDAFSAELLDVITALIALRAAGAVDTILDAVVNPAFTHARTLGTQLAHLRAPTIAARLRQRLDQYRLWAADDPLGPQPGRDRGERYQVMLIALVKQRDVASAPFLKELMRADRHKAAAFTILTGVLGLTDATLMVQDPFILAFRDEALARLHDPWGDVRRNLREPALVLAARMARTPAEAEPILRAGLTDASILVRQAAAAEAGSLKLTSLIPEIRRTAAAAPPNIKPIFCRVLQDLGGSCASSSAPAKRDRGGRP